MEPLALSLLLLGLAGPAAGLGAARAAGALTPVARIADVERTIVAAALWAVVVPLALTAVAGAAWLVPAALFAWGGLAIALADLAALRAPYALSAALGLAGLGASALWAPDRLLGAALAGAGAFVLLLAARIAFRKARGRDGLGGGDPGAFAALAIWAGPAGAPWVLGLGAGLALGVAWIGRLVSASNAGERGADARERVPLASCLVAAAVVVAVASAALTGAPFWISGLFR